MFNHAYSKNDGSVVFRGRDEGSDGITSHTCRVSGQEMIVFVDFGAKE
jgi:hypothetical protein